MTEEEEACSPEELKEIAGASALMGLLEAVREMRSVLKDPKADARTKVKATENLLRLEEILRGQDGGTLSGTVSREQWIQNHKDLPP